MSSLREHLETLVFALVLTLVIWLWAEGESVTVETVEMTVRFVAPEGSGLLIEPASPEPVEVTVEAATRQLRVFREMFARQAIEHTLRYDPQAPLRRQVVVGDVLEAAGVGELGLAIREVQPETIPVRVERMVEVELPVRVRVGDAPLAGSPTVQPESVTLRLRESLASAAGDASIEVPLSRLDLAEVPRDEPYSTTVDLSVPPELRGEHTRITPSSAEVTFTLTEVTDEVTLTTVPVVVSASPLLLARYDIEVPEEQRVLRDVELSGPRAVIEQIRERNPAVRRVVAEFSPTEADLASGSATLPLSLRVPAGVTVTSPIPTVTITATPRNGNGTNANGG